jgi:hypothetical protein
VLTWASLFVFVASLVVDWVKSSDETQPAASLAVGSRGGSR